ncbi:MAG: hypothetical protein WDM71_01360 [Ferruginibacter sp.]
MAIRISYRKFSFVPPDIIVENQYEYCRSNEDFLFIIDSVSTPYNVIIDFLKTFWIGLVITLGLLYGLNEVNNLSSDFIFYAVFAAAMITIVLPFITYFKYVKAKIEYFETLKFALTDSNTYLDFCKKMKKVDERYYKFID